MRGVYACKKDSQISVESKIVSRLLSEKIIQVLEEQHIEVQVNKYIASLQYSRICYTLCTNAFCLCNTCVMMDHIKCLALLSHENPTP